MQARTRTLYAAAAVLMLQACASPTPHWDARFGDAVRTARIQQTANPDAGRSPVPVEGIDGTAAHETMQRYHDSFKAPPPTFEVIFGTGAGSN